MSYDRAAFVQTFLNARPAARGFAAGYRVEHDEYNDALRAHYQGMLVGLETLFGTNFSTQQASFNTTIFANLFRNTAESYEALRTPWSNYLEEGLVVRRLEEAGDAGQRVFAASDAIESRCKESRAAHLEMLDALAGLLLGGKADAVFTSADLLAAGFDDSSRPDPKDFPDPWA